MSEAGSALMGIGSARGDDRAVAAAEMAISSPLLEASIDGARGVLLSISGGSDLGLFEINEAAQLVSEAAHPEANIIFGAVIDDGLGDEVRVTVIAAGFDGGEPAKRRSAHSNSAAGGARYEETSVRDGMREQVLGTLPKPADAPLHTPAHDPMADTQNVPVIPVQPAPSPADELDIPDFLK
jgi:cell division protein FtsZ